MEPLSRRRSAVYLLFLVTVWGVNWPLSKYALQFSPPLLFAGLRIFIGGALLVLFALPHYRRLRLKETWPIYLHSALLNVVLFYVLQTYGLNYLPAGMFAAIVFLQPVLLGIGAWLWLGEAMYVARVAGLILGFAGVAAISIPGQSGAFSTAGVLLGLGSAVSWALGTLYMKRTASRVDAVWVVALQMFLGGMVLLAMGSSVESWKEIVWNVPFVTVLLLISVFVTALGWLVFFQLVGRGEANKVGSYTFLIPLIALAVSVLFLGETVTYKLITGILLVLAGIILVNLKPGAARAANRASDEEHHEAGTKYACLPNGNHQ